jgi:hypothetical protein
MKNETHQPITPLAIRGNGKTQTANGDSELVEIRLHRDGSYSMHFARSFLNLPRDEKRALMKAAVAAKFRRGWPKYWSATAVTEGRLN